MHNVNLPTRLSDPLPQRSTRRTVTKAAIAPALPHANHVFGRTENGPELLDLDVDPLDARQHELAATGVDAALRAFILAPSYPCVGAKSAINRNAYRFGIYENLEDPSDDLQLANHLADFARDADEVRGDGGFGTFAAVFMQPMLLSEMRFEEVLWDMLGRLHEQDRHRFPWDEAANSSPTDGHFSFSIGGRAFFIVGLHPGASRASRRFCWPTLVFNPHDQFKALREKQRMESMQRAIRQRDEQLQGSINPNLADFGEMTEARQYSGRPVEDDWTPPFTPKPSTAPQTPDDSTPDTPTQPAPCPFGFSS